VDQEKILAKNYKSDGLVVVNSDGSVVLANFLHRSAAASYKNPQVLVGIGRLFCRRPYWQ
jgi:hypothetical protein